MSDSGDRTDLSAAGGTDGGLPEKDDRRDAPDESASNDLRPFVSAAEAALSRAWGGPVRLGVGQVLREKYRNAVLRCPVLLGPPGAPGHVIVKASVGEGEHAYDPADDRLGAAAWRFYNEWASTALLERLGIEPLLSARLYGGDRAAGLIIAEDLGDGECLADRLQGGDRARVEAGLLTYARSLGRLHAATVGREAEFEGLRRALGAAEGAREREGVRWLRENVAPFRAQCEALGVAPAAGFDAEIGQVQAALDEPGPFLAFAPGDTCPDNHRFTGADSADGEETVRFFDFEFGGFRHALLDAAYLRAPFPTCWCVNRLPGDLVPALEAAYRAELVRGCPEAGDDSVFLPALAGACAYWAITSVSWNLPDALREDGQWGISTVRQRHPLRLSSFADAAARWGVLTALGATARDLAARLRALWASTEEMPLYPPFRDAGAVGEPGP